MIIFPKNSLPLLSIFSYLFMKLNQNNCPVHPAIAKSKLNSPCGYELFYYFGNF